MPYEYRTDLDGIRRPYWVDPEPVQAEEVKPPLTRHQQMFVDQLQKNVLLRKMMTIAVPAKAFHSNMFDVKKYR